MEERNIPEPRPLSLRRQALETHSTAAATTASASAPPPTISAASDQNRRESAGEEGRGAIATSSTQSVRTASLESGPPVLDATRESSSHSHSESRSTATCAGCSSTQQHSSSFALFSSAIGNDLLSIFYAEFDNQAGPRIAFQAPEGFMSHDAFLEVSNFIITGPELSHTLMTFDHCNHRVLGYPIRLSGAKYARNAFFFTVGFVLRRHSHSSHESSSSATGLAKSVAAEARDSYTARSSDDPDNAHTCTTASLNQSQTASEHEHEHAHAHEHQSVGTTLSSVVLSSKTTATETKGRTSAQATERGAISSSSSSCSREAAVTDGSTKPFEQALRKLASFLEMLEHESEFLFRAESRSRLKPLLAQLLESLNKTGECAIPFNASNTLHLKLFPQLSSAAQVKLADVPMRVRDLDRLVNDEWDLTLRAIIPFIDGVNCVKRIAVLSGVECELVQNAVRQLLSYECVSLVDVFCLSNVYVSTSSLPEFFESKEMQLACAHYVRTRTAQSLPELSRLCFLYTQLQRGSRMGEFVARHQLAEHGIDARRFALFGLVHGIVRRVHKYPLLAANLPILKPAETEGHKLAPILHLLDGRHTYDDICCEIDISHAQLEAEIRMDAWVIGVSK